MLQTVLQRALSTCSNNSYRPIFLNYLKVKLKSASAALELHFSRVFLIRVLVAVG